MNDLTALGTFLACLIVTFGLVHACEWLRPRERPRGDATPGATTKESRQ